MRIHPWWIQRLIFYGVCQKFCQRRSFFMSRLFATSFLARATGLLCLAGLVGITGAALSDARAQTESNGGMTSEESQQYRDCIKLAQLKPEDGFESAIAWRDLGGGEPARHCVAVALISLGKYEEAATRLDALANDSTAGPGVVAGMLAQAGQAWMMAENLEFAWRDQSRALDLVPNNPQLWVDRAMALGLAGQYWEAIDDLNAALDLKPDYTEALIYRASAWRLLESYDLAMTDIQQVLGREPQNVQALFERGKLHQIAGDKDLARKDWLTVIELSNGTPVADAAKANIEKMDVRTGSD
jgi:tetratricopeptide (TPR) repeat protein